MIFEVFLYTVSREVVIVVVQVEQTRRRSEVGIVPISVLSCYKLLVSKNKSVFPPHVRSYTTVYLFHTSSQAKRWGGTVRIGSVPPDAHADVSASCRNTKAGRASTVQ